MQSELRVNYHAETAEGDKRVESALEGENKCAKYNLIKSEMHKKEIRVWKAEHTQLSNTQHDC